MKSNTIETIVGFLVIIVAGLFLSLIYEASNHSKLSDGYVVKASFQNIEGLSKGSDVKMSGIKVGFIDSIALEKDTYSAIVDIKLKNEVKIPDDSRAAVSSSGLLGGKYISINPGASDVNLDKDNNKIKFTQSALSLEDIISKLMYSVTSK